MTWDPAFELNVERITTSICTMLIEKNQSYGNSALNPVRVFSRVDAEQALLVRIDDKLSRIARGREFPGDDTIDDLIGYLVLLKISRGAADSTPPESTEGSL